MNVRQGLTIVLFLLTSFSFGQSSFQLTSPSGEIKIEVKFSDSIYYSVHVNNDLILDRSTAALITPSKTLGAKPPLSKSSTKSVRETIVNPVPFKRKNIPDHYNELTLRFRDQYSLVFRAYDDGIAYRFVTAMKDSLVINNEIASVKFAQADTVYFSAVNKRDNSDIFHTSFEELYQKAKLKNISPSQVSFSPLLVDGKVKVLLTESDLFDYPGMFIRGTNRDELRGVFAGYPDKEQIQGGEFKQPVVVKRKNYIAKTAGSRSLPWRVFVLAKDDKELLDTDLVYRLGSPAKEQDWSWVKPGICTDEWIVGINLHGVDFKAGINTETYKYYIDFADRFGMKYVMLDAGWSDNNDLFKITEGLDLQAIADYAKSKNIGLCLWTLSMTLDRQLEEAMKMFNRLGVKFVMTDFMDRDDQKMMRFYQRIAESAAEHKIMIMFHGAFKNAGFERTYPNSVTREGVLGSEYNIWSDKASPEHDLLIPFIRMAAGPMDYEPGFMTNANKRTFRALPDHVMSQGTRCHQLAMFVAYDSPMQVFSGDPSAAWLDIAYTSFLGSLPTMWDETTVLDARLGDYLLLLRKKDNDWYIAGMTDWTSRELEVDLSFLGKGKFQITICEDGVNAEKYGSDYRMRFQKVSCSDRIKINMAPGGGYVAKIIKLPDGE